MKFRAIKGVQDILPPDVYVWQEVESAARQVFAPFGYKEIRTPVMEFTEVFTRSIGETTDIVEKEMYTFNDRAGRSITLRPEGTAPVVRAYVENHLYRLPSPQKYYYIGPMFRYERPQRGRFRQFHQIGVEAFGEDDPRMDAEVLDMLRRFLERVGVKDLGFEINSIGCDACRPAYREAMVDFLSGRVDTLCADCRRRYEVNPLRVLDCKAKGCSGMKEEAPRIIDYLCSDCRGHFDALRGHLESLGIPYRVNPGMVRGLDYYTRTTFEVTTESLGAQSAVAAGGRYDRLVEEFGGPAVPGIGFAIGMERLTMLIRDRRGVEEPAPSVYLAAIGADAEAAAYRLASEMRGSGIWAELDYSGASLRSQFKRADRLRAAYVFILGEDELARGVVRYKRLSDGLQGEIDMDDAVRFLSSQ